MAGAVRLRFWEPGRSHLRRIGQHPLFWLIAASMALGLLRALVVPPGLYNIDERWHFEPVLETASALRACGARGACDLLRDVLLQGNRIDPYRGAAYYLPQAVVQLALPASLDEVQRLLVARLVTLSLGGVMIALTYRTLREIIPGQRRLALAAAGLVGLVPSLSDMMSGVNLDAGAALVGALIIYTLAVIIRRGVTPARGVALIGEMALGYTLKGTIWPLYLVVVFVVWLRLPRRLRLAAAALLPPAALAVTLPLTDLHWRGAANWFYGVTPYLAVPVLPEQTDASSVLGRFSLEVAGQQNTYVVQYLPQDVTRRLRGKTVTYGVWMRASSGGAVVAPPVFGPGLETGRQPLTLSSEWRFYGAALHVPPTADTLGFFLGQPAAGSLVWYDGMIVAEGTFPTERPPAYVEGQWGGQPFVNLLENPSAESVWPQVKPDLGAPYVLNSRIVALLAWRRTLPAWFSLMRWLLVNFWSGFGGILPGLTGGQMIPFSLLTALAAVGAARLVARDLPRRAPPFDEEPARVGLGMLAAASVAVVLLLLYRADLVPYHAGILVWSSTRHASAGWVALTALLAAGILRWIPGPWQRWAIAAGLLALFWINIYILLRVQYPFQHCALPDATDCLITIR